MKKALSFTLVITVAIAAIMFTATAAIAATFTTVKTVDGVELVFVTDKDAGFNGQPGLAAKHYGGSIQVMGYNFPNTKAFEAAVTDNVIRFAKALPAPTADNPMQWTRYVPGPTNAVIPTTPPPAPKPAAVTAVQGQATTPPAPKPAAEATAPDGDLQAAIQAGVRAELDRREAIRRAAEARKARWDAILKAEGLYSVTALQQMLAANGFLEGHLVDGLPGPVTEKAYKAYQAATAIACDGETCDGETYAVEGTLTGTARATANGFTVPLKGTVTNANGIKLSVDETVTLPANGTSDITLPANGKVTITEGCAEITFPVTGTVTGHIDGATDGATVKVRMTGTVTKTCP